MTSWIEKYIGIPYLELGREKNGVDCYGLCYQIYKNELGIEIPDYFGTGFQDLIDENAKKKLKEELQNFILDESEKEWIEVPLSEAKEFDLVLFNICGYIVHIGIMISKDSMLHSFNGMDCVIEKLGQKWTGRVHKLVRHKSKI